jgi:hypothetical protein
MAKPDPTTELTEDWTPCADPIVSDVIRWNEPIWSPIKKKRGKPDKIGEQMIIGEVLSLAGDAPLIFVMDVQQISSNSGAKFKELSVKPEAKIKRKMSTIELGDCHRLIWKDEGAREFIISEQR